MTLEQELYAVAREHILAGRPAGDAVVRLFAAACFIATQISSQRPDDDLEALHHLLDRVYSFYLRNPPLEPDLVH